MALAVASVSSSTFAAGGSNCVISKPTGLALGNLMIAQIGQCDLLFNNQTVSAPAGWTLIRSDNADSNGQSTSAGSWLFWKVASAADVSGSNYTFTMPDSGTGFSTYGGIIMRITGTTLGTSGQVPTAQNGIAAAGGTNMNFNWSGIAPADASSLYLLFTAIPNGVTISGYSITTSNPSWTQQWDTSGNPTGNITLEISVGSAIRTQTTNTGIGFATASSGGSTARSVGQIISIFYAPAPAASATNGAILINFL